VHSSRLRQAQRLAQYIAKELPPDEIVVSSTTAAPKISAASSTRA